ncbi:hypothetical protein J1G42_12760 [Cellulomonas sp. zg-ZUI222]|uniref:hypothetical protein n=1 Tax=Cellulomonas wangleii TaxID=2816956 RepID=UPI001A93CB95|nr:hypothetical protein [Cellulomonas wangleii]MBO0921695.1 hypothetical protein [Cellulomonas wangleii]
MSPDDAPGGRPPTGGGAPGTGPIEVADGLVSADFSQVELHVDPPGSLDIDAETGLASTTEEDYATLLVPRQHGQLPFRLEVHARPPVVDPAWDAVVELSLRGGGPVRVTGWAGDGVVQGPVLADVDLRARYAVRDGQAGSEQFRQGRWDEPPAEAYVVQLWPSPPAPARVVKAISPWSQYWTFGQAAEAAVQRLQDVPDPDRLTALLDAALEEHPDVAAHLDAGDTRFRAGIIRYAQALFLATHATGAYADLRSDYTALGRLVDARVEARRRP